MVAVQKCSVAFSLMLGTNLKFSIDVDLNISTCKDKVHPITGHQSA
jgi:hypothetical protein